MRAIGPALLAVLPVAEAAAEVEYFSEAIVSSSVIDRGEQIGGPSLQVAVGADWVIGPGEVYGALYRLTPLGQDQEAFADEFDYTLGYAWDGEGYAADISASWLTYPGLADEPSLELAGEIGLDAPLGPTIAAFYDTEFEDYGLEVTAGPEWDVGNWSSYMIARAGFVEPGDGSDTRTYGGFEIGAVRPVGETAEFGGYARMEFANQDSFADTVEGGNIVDVTDSGLAVGAFVAATF
ncbi:hypothetical protein WNY37_02475 [Henriciella sp. AS95]|uniref:hypothetical protein n=1 Tax=Henriciella sp. AS95 TaxID=3135782 RepID=UPI00317B0F01